MKKTDLQVCQWGLLEKAPTFGRFLPFEHFCCILNDIRIAICHRPVSNVSYSFLLT